MPEAALDIGIGANGAVWAVGMDGVLSRWNGSAWQKLGGGGGTRIAVDPAGNPWVVNASNEIWRWTGTAWERIAGSARDLAISSDGTVFVVGTAPAAGGFQILRRNGAEWISESGAAGTSIAAGPSGRAYLTQDAASGSGLLVRGQAASGGAVATAPSSVTAGVGTAAAPIDDENELCWKRSFGRCVGTVPTNCAAGQDKDAGLCYPKCKSGYQGVGSVCWSSFRDFAVKKFYTMKQSLYVIVAYLVIHTGYGLGFLKGLFKR